jgi:hypothetical protein
MMRAICDALNMNTERLKRVSGLLEQMNMMETCLPHPTISSTCDHILAFSSYDGIGAETYTEWKTKIDCLFEKYFMFERKKIKKATSVWTHSALSSWESLTPFNKPQTWKDLKILMWETFMNTPHVLNSFDGVHYLVDHTIVIALAVTNLFVGLYTKARGWC